MSNSARGDEYLIPAAEFSQRVRIQDPDNRMDGFHPAGSVSSPDYPAEPGPVKLSILMAAFNEGLTIVQAIEEVLGTSYPCDVELIVVDDGSSDNTAALLQRIDDPRVKLYRHASNLGKGAALRSALSLATGTHVLPFDADLEYLAEDIPKLLEPVVKRRYDVIFGTRLTGYNTVFHSYRYALGNRLLTRLANLLFDACIADLHTCLKLMPSTLLKDFSLTQAGFGLDSEITALLLRSGIRPFEVPVSYYGRSRGQGKKIGWRDAIWCGWTLLRVRLRRPPEHRRHVLAGRRISERARLAISQYSYLPPEMLRTAETSASPHVLHEDQLR